MDMDANREQNRDAGFGLTKKKSFIIFGLIGVALIATGVLLARMEMTVRSTGTVYAEGQRYVYAATDGVIHEHHVRIGDVVVAGDPLISMDSLEIERRIAELDREIEDIGEALKETEIARRELEVRPLPVEVATAERRLKLVSSVREINEEIMRALQELEEVRAIRSLELNRQRVALFNAELAGLGAELHLEWKQAGLAGIERDRLEAAEARLETRKAGLQRERELLERERDRYTVRAPVAGGILDIHRRYEGMRAEQGDLLVTMAPETPRYRIRTYVAQRNVDLLKPGLEVRMESAVFKSVLEGYVYGRILRVAEAARGSEAGADWENPLFEVTVAVTDTPYPLALGSTMDMRLIIGKRNLLDIVMGRRAGSRTAGESAEQR